MADTYFRARRRKQFTTISNACLRDERLSLEAVGFLSVMVSMSPAWVLNKTWLRSRFNVGREKLDRVIRELKTAGYAIVVQDRDPATGRMGRVTYVFTDESGQFDEPDDSEPQQPDDAPPHTEKPYTGEPVTGKPSRGKPAPKKDLELRNINFKKKRAAEKRPQSGAAGAWQLGAPERPERSRPPTAIDPDPAARARVAGLMRGLAASMREGFARA